MGLDMYLNARLYVGEYSNKEAYAQLKPLITQLPGVTRPYCMEGEDSSLTIIMPVMYWRKANAIHNWFVTEVQAGEDDCRDYHVDFEKIVELDKLVSELYMAHSPELVLERMPPTSGFFFGSTDIDEYFWEDLRRTMDCTHKLIEQHQAGLLVGWDFYYDSSW